MALSPIERLKNFDSYALKSATDWPDTVVEEMQNIVDVLLDVVTRQEIVGPVFDIDGIPGGGLIESGSNANGTYIRLPDGHQICHYLSPTTLQVTAAYGNIFRSPTITTVYPKPFIARPVLLASGQWGNFIEVVWAGTWLETQTGFNAYLLSAHLNSRGFFNWIAIGRWKV